MRTTTLLPRRAARRCSATLLFLSTALAVPLLTDCKGPASCEAVCDNVLDKCTDFATEVARNDCLEECEQRSKAVPGSCAAERDEVLTCLALASSIDCSDPQQSAACTGENADLGACAAGESPTTSATGGGGQPCDLDDECATGLCNWKTDVCATPGDLGAPCDRDEECAAALCNWKTDVCAAPGDLGAPCDRDEECAGALCNWKTDQCSVPGAAGAPCDRDEECASGLCGEVCG